MIAPAKDLGKGSGREERQVNVTGFHLTDNPRELRALNALLRRPMPREHLDREAGCSNGPDLIDRLRRRGLSVPCDMAPVIDRDGREVKRGVYSLTSTDRRKLVRAMTRRGKQ